MTLKNPARASDSHKDRAMESKRLAAIERKRKEPELPAHIIAGRVGAGVTTVKKWLREAGLLTPGVAYWSG